MHIFEEGRLSSVFSTRENTECAFFWKSEVQILNSTGSRRLSAKDLYRDPASELYKVRMQKLFEAKI